jgi:hypothetical protein
MISLMNIIWLQSAPTAFNTIGWKFYLCFIIPGTIGGVVMWVWFPDTLGRPLEEIAEVFGDREEVAVYMRDLEVDWENKRVLKVGGEEVGGETGVGVGGGEKVGDGVESRHVD